MKKIISFVFISILSCAFVFSNNDDFLLDGYEAYRKNDWSSAMFFFRKQGINNIQEEPMYMLIMSEIYGGDYKSALSDSEFFLNKYPDSRYVPYIQYQKGRCLHFLSRNEDCILVLSDFCHQNPDSEMYAAALYWIAEAFYSEYNFDSALALYERIVVDFSNDEKAFDARYRIEMIEQRQREEKLLYLLKVTGEENLAVREDYERQLRLYKAEDKMGLKKQLNEAQLRIQSLEKLLSEERYNSELLREKAENNVEKKDPEVEALKIKAKQLQFLLDEQKKE
ncbi:MAG: tetratricopeptide repeat protein [Treponema sp.]|nr:tetratricopeptide repeat protein [Treponema sp.]